MQNLENMKEIFLYFGCSRPIDKLLREKIGSMTSRGNLRYGKKCMKDTKLIRIHHKSEISWRNYKITDLFIYLFQNRFF